MSVYGTPYRSHVTSAKRHGYYRVPEELKSLLVDLTIFLLQHNTADEQLIYTLAADFLEDRLHKRNVKCESQTHDVNKNVSSISTKENFIKSNSNLNIKISEFADRESKDIIKNAISEYLIKSGNTSNQKEEDTPGSPSIGGIHADVIGNIDLANVYEHLDHPTTIEEIDRCRSAGGKQTKRDLFREESTQDRRHKNAYETLEHPVTLSELQVITAASTSKTSANSALPQDYLQVYQNYAEKSCNELMNHVYEEIVLCRTGMY